ncbi:SIMPL domain-containing protein [Pendulispora brunnea]|uniref:SIMPL domain-containing protein n=1 Tax=Pendulispora brunnea TaxID=2905690 RepID=A0ABZ2KL18_9BACT
MTLFTRSFSMLAKIGFAATTLALSVGAGGCANNSEGAGAASPSSPPSILVVGHSETHAKPDIAYINLGVEERAPTVTEAMQRNSAQMTQLVAALKRVGIAEKDIQTSNFNVRFERELNIPPQPYVGGAGVPEIAPPAPAPAPGKPGAAPKGPKTLPAPTTAAKSIPPSPPAKTGPAGFYLVSNNVQIVVRDVTKVGNVIDSAAGAGSNNIWGINFELEKKDAVEADLRQKAVADARTRAEALAKLSGVEVGSIVSVSEVVSGRDMPPPMPYAAAKAESSVNTPVEAGEMTFHGQIQVVYAIKK